VVTVDGSWKIAGFAHSISSSYSAPAPASIIQYVYDDPFPPVWEELAKVSWHVGSLYVVLLW